MERGAALAMAAPPDRCLVLKRVWLDKILAGQKSLDIRGCRHSFAGHPVYLLESKSGRVRATATLGAARPLTPEELVENKEAVDAMQYKRPLAWPLTGVVALAEPWIVSARARECLPTWVPRARWEAFPADPQAEAPPAIREGGMSALRQRLHSRRTERAAGISQVMKKPAAPPAPSSALEAPEAAGHDSEPSGDGEASGYESTGDLGSPSSFGAISDDEPVGHPGAASSSGPPGGVRAPLAGAFVPPAIPEEAAGDVELAGPPAPPVLLAAPRPHRDRRDNRECVGHPRLGQCVFGRGGQPLRTARRGDRCWMCDFDQLLPMLNDVGQTPNMRRALQGMSGEAKALAEQLIPAEHWRRLSDPAVTERCRGMGARACDFALEPAGGPASVKRRAGDRCLFCTPEGLAAKCGTLSGRRDLASKLAVMKPASKQYLLEHRLPAAHRAFFEGQPAQASGRQPYVRRRPAAAVPQEEREQRWAAALEKRQSAGRGRTAAQKKTYREQVLADRARARRRMQQPAQRAERNAEVSNDTGLPRAARSDRAVRFENWCRYGSWGLCQKCNTVQPRALSEATFGRDCSEYIPEKQCARCSAKRQCPTPQVSDVPEPLKNLSDAAVAALSILEADPGYEIRARSHGQETGYRQHSTMLRFRWAEESVAARIGALPTQDERAGAAAAHRYLRRSPDSSYEEFHQERLKFVQRYPQASEHARLRRMQFIERVGIECAAWPTLFWRTDMTFTHERVTDARRVEREREQRPAVEDEDDEGWGEDDGDAEEDEGGDEQRHSTKRLFAARAMGPFLGLASNFDVVQFVYDLNLWSVLGSKKNMAGGVPMRIMMRGHSFSPLYWKSLHGALIDLVRQIGLPKIFWTFSPYEWSFPYHEYVRDEMAKELRGRLHLPVAETLHMTHVMLEMVTGLLVGGRTQ
jgi:hypothetical protein